MCSFCLAPDEAHAAQLDHLVVGLFGAGRDVSHRRSGVTATLFTGEADTTDFDYVGRIIRFRASLDQIDGRGCDCGAPPTIAVRPETRRQ